MYAVVQIGSRILRSACGTNLSVPPRFWACTYGAATVVAAIAADPARNVRRLSVILNPPGEQSVSGCDVVTPPTAMQGRGVAGIQVAESILGGNAAMQTIAGIFKTRADAERAAALLRALGIAPERITVLSPGSSTDRIPT